MLKIKDNVDLKELEKFGFKIKYNEYTGKSDELIYLNQKDINHEGYKTSNAWHKIIILLPSRRLEILFNETYDIELLYKLIKADLVEEVSNENI